MPDSPSKRRRRPTLEPVQLPPGRVDALDGIDSSGNRYRLTIAGSSAVVSVELIAAFALRQGVVLDPRQAEQLTQRVRELVTFDRAVQLLAVRTRSARELSLALRRRDHAAPEIEAAIAKLVELGVLDDGRYAAAFAAARAAQGKTRRFVIRSLRQRGVAGAAVDEAVREAFPEDAAAEAEGATALALKRVRSLQGLDPQTARRRLYSFLARRGYDPTACRVAMEAALSAIDSNGEAEERGAAGGRPAARRSLSSRSRFR